VLVDVGLGEKFAVVPAGTPLAEKVTAPENPVGRRTEMPNAPVPPAPTIADGVSARSSNAGGIGGNVVGAAVGGGGGSVAGTVGATVTGGLVVTGLTVRRIFFGFALTVRRTALPTGVAFASGMPAMISGTTSKRRADHEEMLPQQPRCSE
jgi:hypothetical protein